MDLEPTPSPAPTVRAESAIEARLLRLIRGTDRAQQRRDLAWLWENGNDHAVVGVIRIGRERGDSEDEIIRAIGAVYSRVLG